MQYEIENENKKRINKLNNRYKNKLLSGRFADHSKCMIFSLAAIRLSVLKFQAMRTKFQTCFLAASYFVASAGYETNSLLSRHLIVQSQQMKHEPNVWNLFELNNKDTRM